ncbi:MAG: hypothetical protein HZC29_06805 [Thaumarchaeota archaeon]|nr:hypothetical protein [Nitrososphaerota archaeon]
MIGLLATQVPLIYSVIVAVAIYIGVKVFVGRRKLKIAKTLPEGVCVDCGQKIVDGTCPNCHGMK